MSARYFAMTVVGFSVAGALLAGSAPAFASASAVQVTLAPAAPTVHDIVIATIQGVWPSGCEGGFTGFTITPDLTGADLRYTVMLASGTSEGGCPAVEVPFSLEVALGKIVAGHHVLEIRCDELGDADPPQKVIEIPFTVTGGEPPTELVLHGGRFEVEVSWTDSGGKHGAGRVVPGASNESGLFWFFFPGNWEVLVKVLDGCAFNGHFWVLGAAATNVQYTVEVLETTTGEVWRFDNPLGRRSPAFLDTTAFGGCAP